MRRFIRINGLFDKINCQKGRCFINVTARVTQKEYNENMGSQRKRGFTQKAQHYPKQVPGMNGSRLF